MNMNGKNGAGEYEQDLELLLTEVSELLLATEQNLVELEKSPADTALIQEVFRVMHTIKGGAATLGLQDAVEVTHRMENVMDGVRSGTRQVTKPVMDALFKVLDWLKDWREAMAGGKTPPAVESIMPVIEAMGDEGEKTQQSGASGYVPSIQANVPPDLQLGIEAAVHQGKPVYRARVKFKSDASLLSVRCFQIVTGVEERTEVIGSVPSMEQIENDQVQDSVEVYFVSDSRGAEAETVAKSNPDVKSVSVEKVGQEVSAEDVPAEQAAHGAAARGVPAERAAEAAAAGDTAAKAQTAVTPEQAKEAESAVVKRSDLGKTVRVDVALLDFLMNMVGELVIDRTRLSQIATKLMTSVDTASIGNEVNSLAAHLQRTSTELQEGIMQARLLPLKGILAKFPRMMRDLSAKCGKEIDFEMSGEDTELDRTVLEAIDDPLIHVLRNAVDHGIEMPEDRVAAGKGPKGHVKISAWHQENQVLVKVEDDGAGIDAEKIKKSALRKGLITEEQAAKMGEKEAIEIIFMPGFSTAEKATEVSGRGVGLDVVRSNLERVNGQIEVKTRVGQGTAITLRLPLTLAIMRALLVKCGEQVFAVPTSSVEEVFSVAGFKIGSVQGKPAINVRGKVVPLVSLEGTLCGDMWSLDGEKYALLTRTSREALALGVDDLIGEEEIVVKEMGHLLSRLKGIAGATILAQGDPAVILDINRVI